MSDIKKFKRLRPQGLTNMSIIVCLGSLFSVALLFFSIPGSRDFYFLVIDALLGFVTSFALCTLQPWGFWFTAAFETYEIAYSLFSLTQPAYWNIYALLPAGGAVLSAIGLVFIFVDRTVRPAFKRVEPATETAEAA